MKLFIASDLHGSALYCRKMLEAFDREGADRLILLGDLLYHGPRNSLPEEYDPRQTAEMLNRRKERILCIRGNCDAEVDQMMLGFPLLSDFALIHQDGVSAYLVHGHDYGPEKLPPLAPGDILLFGHTHVPAWDKRNGVLCLNPGSVSIPKAGSSRGYMLWEGRAFLWKTLEGETWHTLVLS